MAAKFEAPKNASWKGGKFLSLRMVALWASNGHVDFYYLGPKSDLFIGSPSDSDELVLISDGSQFVCSKNLAMGTFPTYRYTYSILNLERQKKLLIYLLQMMALPGLLVLYHQISLLHLQPTILFNFHDQRPIHIWFALDRSGVEYFHPKSNQTIACHLLVSRYCL